MEDGENLQNHIDKLTNLFMKITDMGETFSETMKIGIILSSLPTSWNNLITTLSTTRKKKEELTLSIYSMKKSVGKSLPRETKQ